jgi:hypothetical protein
VVAEEAQSAQGYAAEVAGIARLFQKLGRSVYGLALLEGAWLGLLALLKNLGGGGVNVPVPGQGSVPLTSIAWVGMGIVAIGWVGGRLRRPGRTYVRAGIRLAFNVIKGLACASALLINLALLWLTWPLERLWASYRLPTFTRR